MAVNKVIYDGNTLVDLTGDTVTPETLAEGITAHDRAGNPIVGAMTGAVQKTVETLTGTSGTYTVDGYILNVMLVDSVNKEQVMADVTYSAMTESVNNTVTIDCATAPSNPLYVVILYL